jgi:hypothetical protein
MTRCRRVRTRLSKKGVAAMDRRDAIAWVRSVCQHELRASQAKTLSVLVAAMLGVVRVSLANIGRSMLSEALVKHRIKRAYRFIANEAVEAADAMRGVLRPLVKRWRKGFKNKPLLVSLDWTDVRGLQTLMAAAVIGGRAAPLVWARCTKHTYDGHRSRNAFEEALLLLLRTLIPGELGLEVVILADRGFGRTELGRFCQRYGFRYVIRIQPKVKIRVGSVTTRLDRYPVHKGICRRLNQVLYRAHDPVQQHVVIRCLGRPLFQRMTTCCCIALTTRCSSTWSSAGRGACPSSATSAGIS